jgi:hypothetical protein
MADQKLGPDGYDRALAMRLEGVPYRKIGAALGVSGQRIQQMLAPATDTEDAVIARAGGRCEDCQKPAGRSGHVHHKQAKGLTAEAYLADENLMLLCGSCHQKAHGDPVKKERRRRRTPEERSASYASAGMKSAAVRLGISVDEYRAQKEAGNSWCSFHGAWEPSERFGTRAGTCIEGNRERVRQAQGPEYARDYYRRNKARMAAYQREWRLKKRARLAQNSEVA